MKKYLYIVTVLFILNIIAYAYADTIETESKVSKVTIYINSAYITRQAQLDVKKGLTEIIFTNVPENLNESTLSVSASGQASIKILDAKVKKIYLEKPESDLVRKLQDEIEVLEEKATAFENKQTVINEEREFLKSIKFHTDQQIPKDLITKMPDTNELNSLNNFLKEKWQDTFMRELAIEKELREINRKLEKLRKELAQLRQAQRKEKRIISTEIDVKKQGTLTLSVSYLMYQANWRPEYDVRVDYKRQKIELVCLGIVKQTSGEDWHDIELILSSAKPTLSAKMPELQSWILRPRQPLEQKRRNAMFTGFAEKGMAPSTESEDKMEEVAYDLYARVEKKLTSVNYKIARTVDIKSDGSKHRLPVFSRELSPEFQYSTTPKLSPFAYLIAKVTNKGEQLLPAVIRVFLDNVYVGSSVLDAIGKNEKFDLYLGIDEGIKLKREKIKEEVKDVWIAGIKRNNKVIITTYKITVENFKNKQIKINVFDHIPVSQSDQIVVKVLDINPEPAQENYKDRKGVMRWVSDVLPGKKKEITYTYQIEYPRDMNIFIQPLN